MIKNKTETYSNSSTKTEGSKGCLKAIEKINWDKNGQQYELIVGAISK